MTERPNFKGRVLNIFGDTMLISRQRRLVPETYQEAQYVEFNSTEHGHIIAFQDNKAWTRHEDLVANEVPVMPLSYYNYEIKFISVPPSSEPLRSFMQRHAERPEKSAPVLRQVGAILGKMADVHIMPNELRPPSFKGRELLPHALIGQFAVTHKAGQELHVTASLPFIFPEDSYSSVAQRVTEELSASGFFLPAVPRIAGELAVGSDLEDALKAFKQGLYAPQG